MTDIPQLEKYLKVLGNKKRLQMLMYMKKQRGGTVDEIADSINSKKQATSQHLRILKLAGIITHKKRGLFVTYRLSLNQDKAVKQVLGLL